MSNEVVELIKKSGLTIKKISDDTGIPAVRMYGWVHRGSTPKHQDTKILMEYFKKKMPQPEGYDPIITVLLDRVIELLVAKNHSSALSEKDKIFQDVARLKESLKSGT